MHPVATIHHFSLSKGTGFQLGLLYATVCSSLMLLVRFLFAKTGELAGIIEVVLSHYCDAAVNSVR